MKSFINKKFIIGASLFLGGGFMFLKHKKPLPHDLVPDILERQKLREQFPDAIFISASKGIGLDPLL